MPRITNNYRFYALTEFRDVWYPGYDQRNMVTAENQMEALFQFVGPGVLEGWEVTPMPSLLRDGDVVDMNERNSLADAEPGTYLAKVYQLLGSPGVNDELAWGQIIKVTEGKGVVGVFAAETVQTAYLRVAEPNTVLYVWAEAGLCLAPEGRCHITMPLDGDYDHDLVATATYLATVEVTELDAYPGEPFVLAVTYDERRKKLKNLEGALEEALRLAFYRHVHLGGPDHPSKINLSTYVVFDTEGPAGSTILRVIVPTAYETRWANQDFGIPVVRLDDQVLPSTDYHIDFPGKRIFLRNSLPEGSKVTIKLPLFRQTSLFMHEDSLISDSLESPNPDRQRPIYLTDGSTTTDSNGDEHQVIFTWDAGLYRDPLVTLDGDEVSPSLYTVYPEDGAINFNPPLDDGVYGSTSLKVLLTSLGQEIDNTLSGERLENLDASVFTRGTLDPRRIRELDHVGLVRFKELAVLRPTKRLLQLGDDVRYYPEAVGSALQYASHLYQLFSTVNLPSQYAIGSRRGLIQSADLLSFDLLGTWVPDRGRPKKFVDDLLQDDSQENKFRTTYLLTLGGRGKKGAVFLSANQGAGFTALRMPVDAGVTADASDFYASTQKVQQETQSGVKTYEYSTLYYLGTDRGLWTAAVQEGQTQEEWTWTKEDYAEDQVYALQEICTTRVTTDDQGNSTESQDRTLYVGADDGFYVAGRRINSQAVKGFLWPRAGAAKNQLFWFTDTDIFYSHTGQFVVEDSGGGSTTYWKHPLADAGTIRYPVRVASVANVVLPSVTSLDGVTLIAGDQVLLKDQDDATENGVYEFDGSVLSLVSASQNASVRVEVNGAGTLDGSAWRCRLDGSDVTFEHLWVRAARRADAEFQSVFQESGTDLFYGLSGNGADRCIRMEVSLSGEQFDSVSEEAATWSADEQGAPNYGMSAGSAIYVGGDRGLWRSADSGATWSRPVKQFTSFDTVTVYHTLTGSRVADTEFGYDADTQAVSFVTAQTPWTSYLFEREYVNYYVSPWNPVNADVVVYVNDEVTDIPYALFPEEGRIFFTQTLSPDDEVRITIIRQGAFISNVSSTPHEELRNFTVTGTTALTLLSSDLAGLAPAGTELVLRDRTKVPTSANILELRYRTFQERVGVLVDPVTNRVTLARDRLGDNLFPANFTEVYLVEIKDVLGIEDQISIANSNQTYHLNSLVGANVAQLSMSAEEKDANLYTNFSRPPGPGFEADRGPKSALFFNSATDTFDDGASSSTVFSGFEPSESDQPFNPTAIYCMRNIATDGEGMRVGTDQGIWIYQDGKWKKETDLDGGGRVYFFDERDGVLVAGTDDGLWQYQGGEWVANPIYPQAIFDREAGNWFDGTFEAFGKDDGLAFVWTVGDQPFTSDPFLSVAERRVYGLYKDKFIRIDENGAQHEIDALYLATEAGLFGVTNGATSGTFSAFLAGREMFGEDKLTRQYTDAEGALVTADVKVYRIFRALPRPACPPGESKPSIPLHILTNNGVYKVRNWRWCDPADAAGLTFHVEAWNLHGITCNCYALTTRACDTGVEPLSKIFVGTEDGVWRSYNEGTTYERCERIGGDHIAVYDLQAFGTGLVAATERGIFFSDDDGDSWRRPDPADTNALLQFKPTVSAAVEWEGTYLAQTFTPVEGQTEVTRLGVYIEVEYPEEHDDPEALRDNVLKFELWSTDGSGVPLAPLPLLPSITGIEAGDVTYPGFRHVEYAYTLPDSTSTYALVAREYPSLGSGGTKVFRWHVSTLDNPYADGKAWSYTGSWAEVPSLSGDGDFFFRVFFEPEAEAKDTVVSIDLRDGEGRGLIVDDSGALTTDIKFAGVFVLDDTQSMAWGDPDDGFGGATRGDALKALMNELWRRTKHEFVTDTYYRSWADVFTFGSSIIDRTDGYTNSPASLEIYLGGLFQRGLGSALNETAQLALSTLFPQAVVDAILGADDWQDRVQTVVDYLNDPSVQALRLADLEEWFQTLPAGTRSEWPFDHPDPLIRIATINDYTDVATHVIERWANTFLPLAVVAGDGDDTGSQDADDVALTALSGWPRGGVGIIAMGTDGGHRQVDLKTQADGSGGFYSTIVRGQSGGDWDAVQDSVLHGGANDLFKTGWAPKYEFEEATWVRSVEGVFSAAPGAVCSVSYRVTKDRVNWTAWQELETEVPSVVDDLVYGLEFTITMGDGWDEGFEAAIKPRVESLGYTVVTPGRTYLITEEQDIDGMLFEYLLSPVVDVPRTARLNWGIGRGSSRDFADFERVRTNRKGCLPHRQKSAQFSDEIVRLLLSTRTTDNQMYQVLDENNQPTNWLPGDTVKVYVGGIEVRLDPENPFYTYDYALGRIYFRDELPAGSIVRVTIITPAQLFVYDGEPMTTLDGRVYRAANGRWQPDAQAVVLVNGKVQRGNYWATPEEGTVAFVRELERTDIVTLYVQHAPKFRVGVEVLDYGVAPVTLERFGLFYTQLKNGNLLYHYNNPEAPGVVDGTLELAPENPTAFTRLTVEYDYRSPDNARERSSLTSWWRLRPGEDTSVYSEVDSDGYVRLGEVNGFVGAEDYDNRTVQRAIDVGTENLFKSGDRLYIKVTPYDGFVYGTEVDSRPAVQLGDDSPPWATNATVTCPTKVTEGGVDYVSAGSVLSAQYVFNDLDGDADQSTVAWYNRDGATSIATGASLPATEVTAGRVLSFIVTPNDGELSGIPVRSGEVVVR